MKNKLQVLNRKEIIINKKKDGQISWNNQLFKVKRKFTARKFIMLKIACS